MRTTDAVDLTGRAHAVALQLLNQLQRYLYQFTDSELIRLRHRLESPRCRNEFALEVRLSVVCEEMKRRGLDAVPRRLMPWQLTLDEFSKGISNGNLAFKRRLHRDAVVKALASGRDVPPRVLDDYPNLTVWGHGRKRKRRV